jgi:hypothetical protein
VKNQGKNPLTPVGMQMHIWISGEKIWVARICAPRSAVRIGFRSPLAILPLKWRGGGGSGIGCASLNDLDWGTQIYGQGWILDPPFHSTFNKHGGGPELSAFNELHIVTSPISSTIHLPPYVFHSPPVVCLSLSHSDPLSDPHPHLPYGSPPGSPMKQQKPKGDCHVLQMKS